MFFIQAREETVTVEDGGGGGEIVLGSPNYLLTLEE